MVTLENSILKIAINPQGAELCGVYHKYFGIEYMWNANPSFWPKHSPVLFPIVGTLTDNTYLYNDKKYELPRHGFAWKKQFAVEIVTNDQATFLLESSEETLAMYPFHFQLRLHYILTDNTLSVTYDVRNTGDEEMYFSIGAHPAFNVPLIKDLAYQDYYLEFEETETIPVYSLKGSLIDKANPFLHAEKIIHLTHELFYKDALVFKDVKSNIISIKSNKNHHSLDFYIGDFPYLGIWAYKDAPFVCIEPWEGIADSSHHDQHLTKKEGIRVLDAKSMWQKKWSITVK